MLTRILALLLAILAAQPAYAGSPFIWGSDSRAQGLQASGLFFSNRQTVDYNGQINYVGNQSAVDTTGWTAYADAAQTTPVDCTGGSPNSTWTTTTTTPQRGSSNFVWTHNSGASRQGEGVAYAFTTDRQDSALAPRQLTITADVSINDTDYANGDLAFYVYDVTNAALITPSVTSVTGMPYTFQANFTTTSSTSYRFCIHTAGTGTGQWLANFDNFFVGPSQVTQGTPRVDWTTWTPTGAWSANTTYTGTYMRDGSQLYASVKVATAGAPTSAALTVNLTPLGITINTAAMTDTGAGLGSTLGSCEASDSGTSYKCNVKYSSTTAVALSFQNNASGTEANVTQAAPFTFGASDYVDFKFSVPINEWANSAIYQSGAVPEYSFNTGTWDAADTTSFGYGVQGTLMGGTLTASRTKRVRFSTIQAGDDFDIQGSYDRLSWFPINGSSLNSIIVIPSVDTTGAIFSGVSWTYVSGSATDLDITFGRYINIANDDAPAVNWPSSNAYWRVVRRPGTVQVAVASTATGTSMSDPIATTFGLKEYLHGTSYNGGIAPTVTLSSGGGTLTTVYIAAFRPKQMQDSSWVVDFNIEVLLSSASRTGATLAINGMTFFNTGGTDGQAAVSDTGGSATPSYAIAVKNANTILIGHSSATTTAYRVSGLVKLASKPTWAY